MRASALRVAVVFAFLLVPASAAADSKSGGATFETPQTTNPTQAGGVPSTGPAVPTPTVPGVTGKLKGGIAYAPSLAPLEVKYAIWAANQIIGRPYRYGGGHASFRSKGYDCSGTVSYALNGGGLLDEPLDSSAFMDWGEAGKGAWITVYTNPGHAYAVIAGLRLDTSSVNSHGRLYTGSGPRWRNEKRSSRGFESRHPTGF